jgi:hypothetical protein
LEKVVHSKVGIFDFLFQKFSAKAKFLWKFSEAGGRVHPKDGNVECRTMVTFSTFGTKISPWIKKGSVETFMIFGKSWNWNLECARDAAHENDLQFPF